MRHCYFLLCESRRERPLSLGVFPPSAGSSILTPDPQVRSETLGTDSWRFADPTQPRSNTNLKVTRGHVTSRLAAQGENYTLAHVER